MSNGIGSHQSACADSVEWLTPPHILKALGPFDLDPCAPECRPWDTAAQHYTREDNGLRIPWAGRVWMNPPYGQETGIWLKRLAQHGNGIALVFARTETAMFAEWVWPFSFGLLFLEGRLHFHDLTGKRAETNSGAPSVLIAYGRSNAETLRECGLPGAYVEMKPRAPGSRAPTPFDREPLLTMLEGKSP